ncbi:diaminopimelate decarboxylase [Leucobacter albus]|uniref:Diaminopimelate decarboxylase n=1 Tax=Leucobacter albus TaxID=272210 RepID=A0ABW3TR61_9MICO
MTQTPPVHPTASTAQGQTPFDRLRRILPEESGVNDKGELTIGGVSVRALADEFGTPLHIFDEHGLRRQMRSLVQGLRERWPNSEVLFASKSMPIVAVYAIAASEGMSIDVAGLGELRLAIEAGVPGDRIYMHGNAKSDEEIALAVAHGVGTVIIDGTDDIARLDAALAVGQTQRILLRVIPNIDADTHATQATGGETSKFGVTFDQIAEIAKLVSHNSKIELVGLHVHIGSQILETEPFAEAVRRVTSLGEFPVYDVGGGLGVNYTPTDHAPTVEEYLDAVVAAARGLLPADTKLIIEPGRSTVARAGVTAYSVVTTKQTGRRFVAINGGMADHLDTALTGQQYSPILADRPTAMPDTIAQLVGRQCESGDLFVDNAHLPHPQIGDIVVLAATGAYAYTLTNNYNGALRPAVVFVGGGEARLAVERESLDDLLRLHRVAAEHDWSTQI